MGTEATIRSDVYSKFIHEINPELQTVGKACPLFVPLVEEGLWDDPITEEIARRYLSSMLEEGIDTLIMGCTHYPLIRKLLKRTVGEGVNLVNPAYETAVQMRRVLEWEDLMREEHSEKAEDQYEFYVSDFPERFQNFADSILTFQIHAPSQVNIEEY